MNGPEDFQPQPVNPEDLLKVEKEKAHIMLREELNVLHDLTKDMPNAWMWESGGDRARKIIEERVPGILEKLRSAFPKLTFELEMPIYDALEDHRNTLGAAGGMSESLKDMNDDDVIEQNILINARK
jgi:hypothetical protein